MAVFLCIVILGMLWFYVDLHKKYKALQQHKLSDSSSQVLYENTFFLDHLPFPIWKRNRSHEIVYGNNAYLSLVDDQSIDKEVIPKSQAVILTQKAMQGEGTLRYPLIIEGQRRLHLLKEFEGQNQEICGFAIDLSTEETLKRDLDDHVRSYHAIFDQLSTAVVVYDADMRLRYYNQIYSRMFGIEESFLQNQPYFPEVLDYLRDHRITSEPPDFPAFKKRRISAFTSQLTPKEELIHLPDERTFRMYSAPHPFGGLLFLFENVTDRLLLERKFNTLIAVQRTTLDYLQEGILVFGSDNKIVLSNKNFSDLWMLFPEDIESGSSISDLLEKMRSLLDYGKLNWNDYKKNILSQISDREAKGGIIKRTDGKIIEFSYVPLPNGDHLVSHLDMTDTYSVENALRDKNNALEAADRLKSEFLASVSYELRAPLNTIIGFSEILEQQYFGTLNDRQADYINGILESSRLLLHLINDILDLATIEAGHMNLEPSSVKVKPLLESVISLLYQHATENRVTIRVSCAEDNISIQGDEKRLRQAFFNLLSNAIKFTPPGGEVLITATRALQEVLFSFSDTGANRTELSTHHQLSGGSLGLSLVQHIIELHQGKVIVSPSPPQGTQVICTLPIAET